MGSVQPPLNARPSQLATLAALATLFTTRCLADGETKNYINTIPGYSQLVPCAEHPLSTIVRGMSQGCGENWTAITSYTCFCTRSSSYMSSAISKDVSSYCRNSSALEQVSSAIAVWDAYCDLGVEAGLTVDPLPSSTTSTATPTASSVMASQTGEAGDPGSNSSDTTRTTAIAAGVAVPVGTIALAVAAYFLYRARKANGKTGHPDGGEDVDTEEKTTGAAVAAHTTPGGPVELHQEISSDQIPRPEMAASPDYLPPHEMATDSIYGSVVLEKDGRPVLAEMDASRTF